MTTEKIEKLESQLNEQGKILRKIEGVLEYLAKNFDSIISIKDEVITQKEKIKTCETRIGGLETKQETMTNLLNGVNIKIATFSGVWGAIIYWVSNLK